MEGENDSSSEESSTAPSSSEAEAEDYVVPAADPEVDAALAFVNNWLATVSAEEDQEDTEIPTLASA